MESWRAVRASSPWAPRPARSNCAAARSESPARSATRPRNTEAASWVSGDCCARSSAGRAPAPTPRPRSPPRLRRRGRRLRLRLEHLGVRAAVAVLAAPPERARLLGVEQPQAGPAALQRVLAVAQVPVDGLRLDLPRERPLDL